MALRKIYFFISRILHQPWFLKRIGVDQTRAEAFQKRFQSKSKINRIDVVHFHAASAGELEILIPLIESFAFGAGDAHFPQPLVLTYYSVSAKKNMERLAGRLTAKGAEILYAGFSPVEHEWENFLSRYQVSKTFVSKYEAWPGLWLALAELNIPLIIINAKAGSAFSWVKRFMRWFDSVTPRLTFFVTSKQFFNFFEQLFPDAKVKMSADPRWVQVMNRATTLDSPAQLRVKDLVQSHSNLPKPYAVLGSVWKEDLQVLLPELKNWSGTIWIVPHDLSPSNLHAIEQLLRSLPIHVLVKEMGILAELYSIADWAWVGGGYGKGIHSTLEPAAYRIPIACGPNGTMRFPEVQELTAHQQLTVCHTRQVLHDFMQKQTQYSASGQLSEWAKAQTEAFPSLVEECLRIR